MSASIMFIIFTDLGFSFARDNGNTCILNFFLLYLMIPEHANFD